MKILFRDEDGCLTAEKTEFVWADKPDENGAALYVRDCSGEIIYGFIMAQFMAEDYVKKLYSEGKADLTNFRFITEREYSF